MNDLSSVERKAWSETAQRILAGSIERLSLLSAELYGAGTILSNVDLISEAKAVWEMRKRFAALSSLEYFPETPEEVPPQDETEPLPEGVSIHQIEAVERGIQGAETKDDLLHYAAQLKTWKLPDGPRRTRLLQLYKSRTEVLASLPPPKEPGCDDMEGEEPVHPTEPTPAPMEEPPSIHSRDKAEINQDAQKVFQDTAPKPPTPPSRHLTAKRRKADQERRDYLLGQASFGKKSLNADEHANIDEAVELLLGACVLPHLATAQKAIAALLVSDAARQLLDHLIETRRGHIEEAQKEEGAR